MKEMSEWEERIFDAVEKNGIARRDEYWIEKCSSFSRIESIADSLGLFIRVIGRQVVVSQYPL